MVAKVVFKPRKSFEKRTLIFFPDVMSCPTHGFTEKEHSHMTSDIFDLTTYLPESDTLLKDY